MSVQTLVKRVHAMPTALPEALPAILAFTATADALRRHWDILGPLDVGGLCPSAEDGHPGRPLR